VLQLLEVARKANLDDTSNEILPLSLIAVTKLVSPHTSVCNRTHPARGQVYYVMNSTFNNGLIVLSPAQQAQGMGEKCMPPVVSPVSAVCVTCAVVVLAWL
jgi:hypothetical protein